MNGLYILAFALVMSGIVIFCLSIALRLAKVELRKLQKQLKR